MQYEIYDRVEHRIVCRFGKLARGQTVTIVQPVRISCGETGEEAIFHLERLVIRKAES